MEQDPPDFTPGAATDEPASSRNPTFETLAEELAWWTGAAEGMRRAGTKPPPDVAARLKALRKAAARSGDPFDFDPVPVRARHDGWTPRKQRGYVEGLADTGCASEAAARVGMTEQSANRLRRRPDARGFDIACEAALEFGLRGLRSVAWERAVKGVVQQIWYHGELKGERRVYSDRLLIYLLDKGDRQLARPAERRMALDDWPGWLDQLERGFPDGVPEPVDPAAPPEAKAIWRDGKTGKWWTRFPPPEGFAGKEKGWFGGKNYRRTLSPGEREQVDLGIATVHAQKSGARDLFFGLGGGTN
ncbi:MAG: hypothetical protein QOD42_1864 [Sphingomonadales bacterium]|jgi:hypothetical protein|nr:hypothetical protein [Sphingomonadales bacterium]